MSDFNTKNGSQPTIHDAPVAADAPMPNRKTIRSWLTDFAGRNTAQAIGLLAFDYLLFLSAIAATILLANPLLKLLCGLAAGFVIGRLFILGHDACHQSYTDNRKLNKILGRIAFLPSITPYSLWDVGHNVVHHGYTNLKGFDFVWQPSTLEEFQAMSPGRQVLERIYRSGWAPWMYYMIEVWWLRMFFPSKRYMGTRRAAFTGDCLLVSAFGLLWIAAVTAAAVLTSQPVWLLLITGFVVPFVFWNGMIGFVVYVHHTHTRISWHDDKAAWAKALPFVSTTVHLTFRRHFGAMVHHIMEHTAHHVDMGIPLYHLKQAQKLLEEKLPGRIVIQPFSWKWYFGTAARCKLYDFKAKCWTDFAGHPSGHVMQ